MKLIEFNKAAGQVTVDYDGTLLAVDVPIEGGNFVTGDALLNYLEGFRPFINTARIALLDKAPGGADEIAAMCVREFQAYEPSYADLRRLAYPPIEDYLDAIVKDDKEQLQAYLDACRAVKEQYPKVLVSDELMRQRLQEAL